jgi:putative glutathione S-transferase
MGVMRNGIWQQEDFAKRNSNGRYMRAETQFRDRITADGSSGFPAEAGRYHIFNAHACPWAYRTLTFRALKGLEDVISVSHVEPLMLENGWEFPAGGDALTGARYMHDVYAKARSDYTGRCSVPVLWDKQRGTIICNESADIIRMLNTEFDALATREVPDLYPEDLRAEIDAVNELVYHSINNGVYKTGFATTQEAYEEAFTALFDALDRIEARLDANRYLCGPRITEADWRLFATLIRFDAVYVGHFKCNLRRIADYPNLSNYTRELYQWPGIAAITDFARIKQHYYGSHESINPFRIVPKGPALDFDAPHDRGRLPAAWQPAG